MKSASGMHCGAFPPLPPLKITRFLSKPNTDSSGNSVATVRAPHLRRRLILSLAPSNTA